MIFLLYRRHFELTACLESQKETFYDKSNSYRLKNPPLYEEDSV